MKEPKYVKCLTNRMSWFSYGGLYEYSHTDWEGDIWVKEDDEGDMFFFHPTECELIYED